MKLVVVATPSSCTSPEVVAVTVEYQRRSRRIDIRSGEHRASHGQRAAFGDRRILGQCQRRGIVGIRDNQVERLCAAASWCHR